MLQHAPTARIETLDLIVPTLQHLASYADALRRGWSPDNVRLEAAAREELARIEAGPVSFIASLDNREAKGGTVTLPDGSIVQRLPGFRRWMWDAEFCGSIGFRWQPGTSELPAYVLGHIGYAVVPWKRRLGYATRALGLLLPMAKREGLDHVELTADPDNLVSHKVITANGGVLVERFNSGPAYGNKEELRFRIDL